jgi:glutamate N-acetyltransferase/amino-acid N-acetyltransferase
VSNGPPELYPVRGVKIGTVRSGERYRGRDDLVVLELSPGSHVAATFTRNAFCAAPVQLAKTHKNIAASRYLLINAGNANAVTGTRGLEDARACCQMLSEHAGCPVESVLPFSTGVIGTYLNLDAMSAAIPVAFQSVHADGWMAAAHAIMTTDTVPKGISRELSWQGERFVVTGIAKGAGMIRPDMATMLAFIATDMRVSTGVLQQCLEAAVGGSFHRITVDGDTSTNDACVLIATGQGRMDEITDTESEAYAILSEAVADVCLRLAQAVVRDGEGATKFVSIVVRQGSSQAECLRVAYTIAHSPLVKTALFASDPNWGRILAAVGRAGVPTLDISKVALWLDHIQVVQEGAVAVNYKEDDGREVMVKPEFTIGVDLGRGSASATIWTCDLSQQYVTINAEYRT